MKPATAVATTAQTMRSEANRATIPNPPSEVITSYMVASLDG